MGYGVRRVSASDWAEYKRLRLEALRDSPMAFLERYEESVQKPDDFWAGRMVRSESGGAVATFVAPSPDGDGRFVGKATGFRDADVTDAVSVEVVGVYVTPGSRGSGIADALVEAVVDWARAEAGAERIGLYVVDSNTRAAAFYRRLGFVETGQTVPYPHDPAHAEIRMVLPSRLQQAY